MRRNEQQPPVKAAARPSFRASLAAPGAKVVGLLLLGSFLMMLLFGLATAPKQYSLQVGMIARETITATKDVVDEITTRIRMQQAASEVEPTYHLEEGASEQVMQQLASVFAELSLARQSLSSVAVDQLLPGSTIPSDVMLQAQAAMTTIHLTEFQMATVLRSSQEAFDTMVEAVTTAVNNALNTTIREGQEAQSIQNILQFVGFRVDLSLVQNVLPAILHQVIKPNMTIEQAATALAREAAMDGVEPVMYLQGQNIIRAGERVSESQLAVLTTLGLLADHRIDFSIFGGASLMVLLAMGALTALLWLLSPTVFQSVKQMAVIMLVMLLTLGISLLVMTLIDVYLAPIAMASMLLTVLVGPSAGLAVTFPMALLVSTIPAGGNTSYTVEMVLLLVMGTLGSFFSVLFLRERPQRLRMLLCGVLVALIHGVVITALGLMTSVPFQNISVEMILATVSGVLSGILGLGLLPLMEALFNLATPSKLMELANPNQPLLRRLLLEAPGTYHHSIVVANLAEAAAEAIHANALLTRTGAYYHDIGKLKRPMYFKENQRGENPHDHTDPYVSAEIVTAHTTDGEQLADKHRLPREVRDIISQHHGDTPVMYFYHKALQMADGKPVDINKFRYKGPRPSTKEACIVMLADTTEAAVRSMHDPTPGKIRQFIVKLVRGKLEDGQLAYSNLTLQDLDAICDAFTTVLSGVFHERIEYQTVQTDRQLGQQSACTTEQHNTQPIPMPEQEKSYGEAVVQPDQDVPATEDDPQQEEQQEEQHADGCTE